MMHSNILIPKQRITSLFTLCVLVAIPLFGLGQIRINKLLIKQKEIFEFGLSDIIVADTLVMMDSSKILLNGLKTENYLRAKVAIIGKNCWISGKGINGHDGYNGSKGKTLNGPCQPGGAARNGARGLDGGHGINLFLYLDEIIVNGSLIIDLSGGNAGDGGEGGEGGGGSPGTVHCNGGNGGKGGDGGAGGDGGRGGNLTFVGTDHEAVRMMLGSQIIVNTIGGNRGYGGLPGIGGAPGLGPSKRHGKPGLNGTPGARGRSGDNGVIQFEQQ
jgi:hypothetical protein